MGRGTHSHLDFHACGELCGGAGLVHPDELEVQCLGFQMRWAERFWCVDEGSAVEFGEDVHWGDVEDFGLAV